MSNSNDWVHQWFLPKLVSSDTEFYNKKYTNVSVDALPVCECNWASRIYFITIQFFDESKGDGSGEKFHLTIKRTFERQSKYSKDQFFNETLFYSKILKYFEDEAKNNTSLKLSSIFPKFYCALNKDSEKPEQVIVLEDLRKFGYRLGGPFLSFEHVSLALKELGKLHSVSYACKIKNFQLFESEIINKIKDTSYINAEDDYDHTFALVTMNSVIDYFDKQPDFKFRDKLTDFKKVTTEYSDLLRRHLEVEEPLAVLCHGDFIRHNLLFKSDSQNSPVDIKFVDMQLIKYASPAVDISVLIFMNLHPKVRINEWNKLIEVYHSSMTSSLAEILGCDISDLDECYSLKNVEKELFRHGAYGYYMSLYSIPWMIYSKKEYEEAMSDKSGKNWKNLVTGSTIMDVQIENALQIFQKFSL